MEFREEFEKWIQGTRNFRKYNMSLVQTVDGQYKDFRVNTQWRAFQAGIDAMEKATFKY